MLEGLKQKREALLQELEQVTRQAQAFTQRMTILQGAIAVLNDLIQEAEKPPEVSKSKKKS